MASFSNAKDFIACPDTSCDLVIQSKEIFKCLATDSLLANLINDQKTKNILRIVTDGNGQPGSSVRIRRQGQLIGPGVTNCETLEGKEVCPDDDFENVELGLVRQALCMNVCGYWGLQERGFLRTRNETVDSLKDWLLSLFLKSFFNQLGSYTAAETVYNGKKVEIVKQYRGFNKVTPSSAHYRVVTTEATGTKPATSELVNITGNISGENDIANKDKFTVSALRQLIAVKTSDTNVCGGKPLDPNGYKYILFLHPSQVADLKADPEWQKWVCCADDKGDKNRLTTGALGVMDGIILKSSELVPPGVYTDGTPNLTVRRAILAGADAAVLAIGGYKMGSDGRLVQVPFKLDYETRDYNAYTALGISTVFGLKKTTFNGKDSSVMLISSRVSHPATITEADTNADADTDVNANTKKKGCN